MTISVVVVEGELSALHSMGFPLPVLAALQEAKLHLQDACWDLKKSNSGISVSFFWPTVSTNCVAQAPPKRKKRRRRRHKIANPSKIPNSVSDGDTVDQINRNTPVDAHHDDNSLYPRGEIADRDTGIPPLQKNPDSVLMEPEMIPATKVSLDKSCIGDESSDVYYYELDDNNPGLCCEAKDGSITWSPIKMTERSIRAASVCCDEADVIPPSNCASISFEWKDSVPGLEIERKEDDLEGLWIPVACRTRSRLKNPP